MDDESNPLLEIIQLIDSAIECDEYDEAFFLFIKFVRTLSNADRDTIFQYYANVLNGLNVFEK
jgi:hypothetical protein